MPLNEADTCRVYVTPNLRQAGWEQEPHSLTEQKTFTDGRVKIVEGKPIRGEKKRADYLLRYTRDFPIAVVEAKPEGSKPGTGLQQAKEYAEILGLKFAYATDGHWIIEFDYTAGTELTVPTFPTPCEIFGRLKTAEGLDDEASERLLTPLNRDETKLPRYYQETAINAVVAAMLGGRRRVLLCMATGTGKTLVAFQICWKLWSARWNREGSHRKPRILFLADRNVLVDDPKDKTFTPFGEARFKIEGGVVRQSREMYFAIYQAIAKDKARPGLYRQYPQDFFDLVIVDECHRGSARDQSNWREILEWFQPAYQLGMTATPRHSDNVDTYRYFGNPVYTYSLRQGIEDGFLAPYRVHRVVTDADAAGWRPSKDQVDRFGREIPDEQYETKDFERIIALRARTEAIAKHLTSFMRRTDRWAKTIVFCVDQEHALEMRRALTNLNKDLVARHPDYVERVTSDEGNIGRGHLSNFQEPERSTPVILTSSQMLTTGVDAPTCKNVVLVRVVNAMTEFKQIIGRGTRMREDYGKTWFNIIDYTGSATERFADSDFDGYPEFIEEIRIDEQGNEINLGEEQETYGSEADGENDEQPGTQEFPGDDEDKPEDDFGAGAGSGDPSGPPRKYYIDDGQVEIIGHLVYELDEQGNKLQVVQYTDYTASQVRTLFRSPDSLQAQWADPLQREYLLARLKRVGVDFPRLAATTGNPDADPLDLLCHLAFQRPLRTRQERADHLRNGYPDFFDQYSAQARAILDTLLDKYEAHGPQEFQIPHALEVPPIAECGNPIEIANLFGGAPQMREAVDQLQALLYAEEGDDQTTV